MLLSAGSTPHDVLAVLRAHAAGAAGEDELLAIGVQALAGGRNNAVYYWESLDGPVCVKIYQVDDRCRAEREWLSLTFLSGHRVESAPVPMWADPHPGQPAIGMTFLPGRPFSEAGDRHEPLRALAAVQRQYAELPLHGELATVERIDSASHYIRRITGIWAPVIRSHPRDALTRDLLRILGRWEDSGDAAVLAEPARRIFSRGDSNLLNWLWDRPRIRVVDYEFAGYSDLAFDCADLTEHISSRQAAIDERAWAEITCLAGLGGGDQRRFQAAQHTLRPALARRAVEAARHQDRRVHQPVRPRPLPAERGAAHLSRLRRELPVTALTDPGLNAFAATAAGPPFTIADRSWPRDGSRVWELTSASGERFYLKQHQSRRFHEREVTAYRLWTRSLGTGRAPRLMAADPRQRAILITALRGQIARGPHVLEADEMEIHRQAGMLLRRLHDSSTVTAVSGTGRVAARAEEHIAQAGALLDAEDAQLVRYHAARLPESARRLPAVPTRGDAQPKNFIWDPDSRQVALIDFERAEAGLAVRDFVRLEYGVWDGRPFLRDAFLDGYGRALNADEESALRDLAALDAVSAVQWGSATNDADIMTRAYRTLARLRPAAPSPV